jgi:predicted phage gp36 major capsid-like protein
MAKLQPGMPMPRSLRGLGQAQTAIRKTPSATKPMDPETAAIVAQLPERVSDRTAKNVQIAGVIASGVFGLASLIAEARQARQAAHTFAVLSILSTTVIAAARIIGEE